MRKSTKHGAGRADTGRRYGPQACRSLADVITGGSDGYDRVRHLARLIPVGPDEIADDSPAATEAILVKLSRALRAERIRGRAGHWTYDLNRHLALSQAHAAESRMARRRAFRLPSK